MSALEQLRVRSTPPRTVAELLGEPSGGRFFRVLHPAADTTGDHGHPVSWREVAERSGRSVDLGRASWFDVSGSRLHHPRLDLPVDAEPAVGPVPEVLLPVLRSLAPGDGLIRLAEWTGYDERLAGRPLTGAENEGVVPLAGRPHALWRTDQTTALGLVSRAPGGPPADRAVSANYLFGPDWTICSDVDLASSYLVIFGQAPEPSWSGELEVVGLTGAEPLG